MSAFGASRQQDDHSEDIGRNFIELVENANDGVVVIVGAGIIAYINPYAAQLVGRDPEQVIGRKMRDFLHPQEFERVWGYYQQRMRGEHAPTRYRTLLLRDDDEICVEVSVAKTNWANEPASFVILRDVADNHCEDSHPTT
mgnify:CR=1 FL=1